MNILCIVEATSTRLVFEKGMDYLLHFNYGLTLLTKALFWTD